MGCGSSSSGSTTSLAEQQVSWTSTSKLTTSTHSGSGGICRRNGPELLVTCCCSWADRGMHCDCALSIIASENESQPGGEEEDLLQHSSLKSMKHSSKNSSSNPSKKSKYPKSSKKTTSPLTQSLQVVEDKYKEEGRGGRDLWDEVTYAPHHSDDDDEGGYQIEGRKGGYQIEGATIEGGKKATEYPLLIKATIKAKVVKASILHGINSDPGQFSTATTYRGSPQHHSQSFRGSSSGIRGDSDDDIVLYLSGAKLHSIQTFIDGTIVEAAKHTVGLATQQHYTASSPSSSSSFSHHPSFSHPRGANSSQRSVGRRRSNTDQTTSISQEASSSSVAQQHLLQANSNSTSFLSTSTTHQNHPYHLLDAHSNSSSTDPTASTNSNSGRGAPPNYPGVVDMASEEGGEGGEPPAAAAPSFPTRGGLWPPTAVALKSRTPATLCPLIPGGSWWHQVPTLQSHSRQVRQQQQQQEANILFPNRTSSRVRGLAEKKIKKQEEKENHQRYKFLLGVVSTCRTLHQKATPTTTTTSPHDGAMTMSATQFATNEGEGPFEPNHFDGDEYINSDSVFPESPEHRQEYQGGRDGDVDPQEIFEVILERNLDVWLRICEHKKGSILERYHRVLCPKEGGTKEGGDRWKDTPQAATPSSSSPLRKNFCSFKREAIEAAVVGCSSVRKLSRSLSHSLSVTPPTTLSAFKKNWGPFLLFTPNAEASLESGTRGAMEETVDVFQSETVVVFPVVTDTGKIVAMVDILPEEQQPMTIRNCCKQILQSIMQHHRVFLVSPLVSSPVPTPI